MTALLDKPKRPHRNWTSKELSTAAELYRTNSIEEVAQALGRTVNSVEGAFAYHGIYKSAETKALAESQKKRRMRASRACLVKAMRESSDLLRNGKADEALDVIDGALRRMDGPTCSQ